jgi:hypothetical protein
LGTPGRGEE